MILELTPAPGTIDLPASDVVIELSAPPLATVSNFRDYRTLVNENGDTLVNENGDTLVAPVIQDIRTNVIDLGA